jgi:hypothetical protein
MVDLNLPAELEERIKIYEDPANDPGGFSRTAWMVVLGSGVLFPAVAILIGWNFGWPS